MEKMENPHAKQLNALAEWAFYNFDKERVDHTTCPKVGWLGWANGMDWCQWLAVSVATAIISKNGGNRHDYFDYDVDSSG